MPGWLLRRFPLWWRIRRLQRWLKAEGYTPDGDQSGST